MNSARLVCWWSAGVPSAVAAAVALQTIPATEKVVAYCANVESVEHPDNARFLADCERWYGQTVQKLYSPDFRDTWDVFERTRWLVGVAGARCTTELKKKVRWAFERHDDIQVFGYASDPREVARAERFRANNPEVDARFPLIDAKLSLADCHALLREQGIAMPAMYELGYRNNNCIGCVKGGAGYWNKIRRDFPDVFTRMAATEKEIGATILRRRGVPLALLDLPPDMGRYAAEPVVECGPACGDALETVSTSAGRLTSASSEGTTNG